MIRKVLGIILLCIFLIFAITNVNYVAIAQGSGSNTTTVDDIIDDADAFIDKGSDSTIDTDVLQDTTNFLYNLLLGIGMIVAVLVGIGLGIHYMVSSVYQKAEVKKTLFWYVIACAVLFVAFTIWRIVMLVFSKI